MTYILLFTAMMFAGCGEPPKPAADEAKSADVPAAVQTTVQTYDSPTALVASMTRYYVGVVTKGPKWTADTPARLEQMRKDRDTVWQNGIRDGKLVGVVRPVGGEDVLGLLFFKVQTTGEMQAIAWGSPAVKEGLVTARVEMVWGTKGLGAGLQAGKNIEAGGKPAAATHYMVVFKKGDKWSPASDDPSTRAATSEQTQYVYGLHKAGTLKFFCVVDDVSVATRGVMILASASADEAAKVAAESPMVKKGWLVPSVVPIAEVEGTLP
jgi:hypothetical protein